MWLKRIKQFTVNKSVYVLEQPSGNTEKAVLLEDHSFIDPSLADISIRNEYVTPSILLRTTVRNGESSYSLDINFFEPREFERFKDYLEEGYDNAIVQSIILKNNTIEKIEIKKNDIQKLYELLDKQLEEEQFNIKEKEKILGFLDANYQSGVRILNCKKDGVKHELLMTEAMEILPEIKGLVKSLDYPTLSDKLDSFIENLGLTLYLKE